MPGPKTDRNIGIAPGQISQMRRRVDQDIDVGLRDAE